MRKGLVSILGISLLGVTGLWPPAPAHAARPLRVAFLNPAEPGFPFWQDATAVMRAAADDLDVTLDEVRLSSWPTTAVEQVSAYLRGPDRPDYLLATVHRQMGPRLLALAERERVPIFVINSGLLAPDQRRYGGPRRHFKQWIGQMLPDEEQAGFGLAGLLIGEAKRRRRLDGAGRVRMAALTGSAGNWVTQAREAGLRRAVAGRQDVVLEQVVPTDWTADQARAKTPLLLARYPGVSALWAAGDRLALGAISGAADRPLITGGFDWRPEALEAIAQHRMLASYGGQVFEGGWALVLLRDHHAGRDFARERLDWRTAMRPITRQDVARYRLPLKQRQWDRLDFRAFSMAYHPALTRHAFSVDALLAQLADRP